MEENVIENKIVGGYKITIIYFWIFVLFFLVFLFLLNFPNAEPYITYARYTGVAFFVLVVIMTVVLIGYMTAEQNPDNLIKKIIITHKTNTRFYRQHLLTLLGIRNYRLSDINSWFESYRVSKNIFDNVKEGNKLEISIGKYSKEIKYVRILK